MTNTVQDVISFFNNNGIYPQNPVFDGSKFDRFPAPGKRKDDQWFIGFTFESNGEPFYYGIGGDWSDQTKQRIDYKSEKKLSNKDKRALDQQWKKVQKEQRKRREKDNEQAIEEAKNIIEKSPSGVVPTHAYLVKKKIQDCPNLNIFYDERKNIFIPVRRINGDLSGGQRILANKTKDGKDKFFIKGTQKKYGFHLIGKDEGNLFYMVEGFATGASVHMATGKPVIVAFDSGNLVPVARAWKEKRPDVTVVVCADDDYKSDKNAGQDRAKEASMITGMQPLTPLFKSERGTDWNDLHCIEGLEEVVEQLPKEETPPTKNQDPFRCMGCFGDDKFVFYENQTKSLIRSKINTNQHLSRLAEKEYWEALFSSDSEKETFDSAAAKDWLIQESKKVGNFNAEMVRGVGVWKDGKRIVVNNGSFLLVDGEKVAMPDFDSEYCYTSSSNKMPPLHKNPHSVESVKPLVKFVEDLNWKKADSAYFLLGWIAIARISGALDIRPHVWVTGASGTGKTTIIERLVKQALGKEGSFITMIGATTEAGVRQTASDMAMPIVFDEFETDGKKSSDRIQSILELLRQSWKNTNLKVRKGTPTGGPIYYGVNFAALVSSIRVNLQQEQDRNRFNQLELEKIKEDKVDWPETERRMNETITEDFGERLFSRSVRNIRTIMESVEVLKRVITRDSNPRNADQWGTLLAGYHSLVSDKVITEQEAEILMMDVNIEEMKSEEIPDEDKLLNTVLTKMVRVSINDDEMNNRLPNGEMMIQRMIKNYTQDKSDMRQWDEQLANYGIYFAQERNSGKELICFRTDNSQLLSILKDSAWNNTTTIRNSLSRVEGADLEKVRNSKTGKNGLRCVRIPLEYVLDLID